MRASRLGLVNSRFAGAMHHTDLAPTSIPKARGGLHVGPCGWFGLGRAGWRRQYVEISESQMYVVIFKMASRFSKNPGRSVRVTGAYTAWM